MFDLFPSGNLSYLLNNNKLNNNYNNNINNSNKKKNKDNSKSKSKSLNITHNTINMNKNNVMINLNANIINTNTPIEKFKMQQKLNEYKKFINKKLNEISKNKKNVKTGQILISQNKNLSKLNNKKKESLSTSSLHYKKINKYFKRNNRINDKNKRKISPLRKPQNVKLNFNSNSSNKILTKNNNEYIIKSKIKHNKLGNNIIIHNTNNNIASRSSSNNSKSSLNIAKNKNRQKFIRKPTLKNFVFKKS